MPNINLYHGSVHQCIGLEASDLGLGLIKASNRITRTEVSFVRYAKPERRFNAASKAIITLM